MANNQDNTSTANDERYNGWTNYETWAVGLWIDNDQGTYFYWRDEAASHAREADNDEMVRKGIWTTQEAARYNLARQLKDEIIEAAPDIEASVYSDLLQAAFDTVNWTEIAENLLIDFAE